MSSQLPSRRTVHFSDTTLRDGEQMPGASLGPDEKVRLARALAEIGIASLDAGFPACAPSEIDAIRRIVAEVRGPSISALCRTLPGDIDRAWDALCDAPPDKRAVSLFVATSPIHREHKLRRDVTTLVHTVRHAIEYARQRFAIVAFSPEDASRTEPDVLHLFYREAIDAGARVIGFPDTVGVLTPAGVRTAIRGIQDGVPNIDKAHLAGHFHNDLGLATANTLAALEEGVSIVQGTMNGIGERAGNTALEEVAMTIALHGDALGLQTTIAIDKLWAVSRLVAELTGIPLAANKPIVGANIFATEAGIHQDGLLKHPDTYLPFRPEQVGAPGITLVLGKHSGRAAFQARLAALGYNLADAEIDRVIALAKAAPKAAWHDEASLLERSVITVRTEMDHHAPHVRYSADRYDSYTARYVQAFDEMVAERIVDEVRTRAADCTLLDVGTGTARLLAHLAGLAPLAAVRFVGTDLFADMLDRARQTVRDAGVDHRIELLQQDVHSMDLADEFADIIISRSTIHHWANPPRAFAEIYRVLKSGGVALVIDVRRDPAPEAIAEFNRQRALAGIGPSNLDEKFTPVEVQAFLREAQLDTRATIHTPKRGLAALAYAIEIRKPDAAAA